MEKETRTPKGRIRAALRLLWLRSRERSECLKRDGYACVKCGIKQSKAKDNIVKVEVHHKVGVGNWNKIIELIQEELLCNPKYLETLCKDCHKEETYDNSG